MDYIIEVLKEFGLTDDAVLTPKLIREAIAVAVCSTLTQEQEDELNERLKTNKSMEKLLEEHRDELVEYFKGKE